MKMTASLFFRPVDNPFLPIQVKKWMSTPPGGEQRREKPSKKITKVI
jgi:hypothetical protein